MTSRRTFLAGAGALAVSPLLPAGSVRAGEGITLTEALGLAMSDGPAVASSSFASFGGSTYFLSESGFQVWRNAWMSTALQRIMADAPTDHEASLPVTEYDETTEEYYADEYD